MDLSKYVSLLKSQAIYLPPLSAFTDPFEGSNPKSLSLKSILANLHQNGDITSDFLNDVDELSPAISATFKTGTYVSCWHLSEYESDAMWKLYSSNPESICIQTTYKKLKSFIPNENAHIGKVQYVDYETYSSSGTQIGFNPAFFKRRSFEHEKEVRVVLVDMNPQEIFGKFSIGQPLEASGGGRSISVNLSTLIDRVRINPLAPPWFADVVSDVTVRYGFDFAITQSELLDKPVF